MKVESIMPAEIFSLAGKNVWVAGHRGMVGAAVSRRLEREACTVMTVGRQELDLLQQAAVMTWMARHRPQVVVLAAAKVGGIVANNTLRADFLYENLAVAMNVIHAAYETGVEKLLFLGSTCVYPRLAPQPLTEDSLLTGPLEPTNEPYAIAKIAGIKLCETYRAQYGADFISVMPTNLYGPGDNYHPEHSHVVAALIRRFHEAKLAGLPEVVVWGTGKPRREFLYVDEMADACVFALKNYSGPDILNIGTGEDIAISEFAALVAEVVGYEGRIVYDSSRPDGTPRKLVDVTRMKALGWQARLPLREGLRMTYASYCARQIS
jgi:GDP-L-fucose synthase